MSIPVNDVLTDDTLTLLAFIVFIPRHPFDKLAAEPESFALNVVKLVPNVPDAIFEAVAPEATVAFRPELPSISAFTVTFVFLELSLVLAGAIKPLQNTLAVFLVVDPHACVLDPIRPGVHSLAVDQIVSELPFVDATVGAS